MHSHAQIIKAQLSLWKYPSLYEVGLITDSVFKFRRLCPKTEPSGAHIMLLSYPTGVIFVL